MLEGRAHNLRRVSGSESNGLARDSDATMSYWLIIYAKNDTCFIISTGPSDMAWHAKAWFRLMGGVGGGGSRPDYLLGQLQNLGEGARAAAGSADHCRMRLRMSESRCEVEIEEAVELFEKANSADGMADGMDDQSGGI